MTKQRCIFTNFISKAFPLSLIYKQNILEGYTCISSRDTDIYTPADKVYEIDNIWLTVRFLFTNVKRALSQVRTYK